MKKIILGLMLLMSAAPLGGCTDPSIVSQRALSGMGMTDIELRRDWFGGFACSDSDTWSRQFTATGPTGRPVSGSVCGGYVTKGATVRFD